MHLNKEVFLDGDIVLFHHKGFNPMAWAIRRVTCSYWNHAGIYADSHIIEAVGNGVVKTPVTDYNDKDYDYKVVRIKKEVFRDKVEEESGIFSAVSYAEGCVGKNYDWGGVIWLGVIYIFKAGVRAGIRFNPFQSRQKFFCSELVCMAYNGVSSLYPAFFQGKTKQGCDTTTPKDLSKSQYVFFVSGLNRT